MNNIPGWIQKILDAWDKVPVLMVENDLRQYSKVKEVVREMGVLWLQCDIPEGEDLFSVDAELISRIGTHFISEVYLNNRHILWKDYIDLSKMIRSVKENLTSVKTE